MRYVAANHALLPDRPAALAYREIEDGLHPGRNPALESEVIGEARSTCTNQGPYPPKGDGMAWTCKGNKEDCARKKRLSDRVESLIVRDVTDSEMVRDLKQFFAEESKLSLQ